MTVGLDPGTHFAGYRVESLVARGGMGVVYRAVDLTLHRPVALKLIAPELAADERFRVRFLRESRLAASLDHANVVPIYEAGEHEGQLYLAMRYVEGSDLQTYLPRQGALGPERSLPVLAQVASALDAAHRRALVHRDVKPGNILIDADGHAYLSDFGVTKRLGGDTTDTGRMVGTLDYIAPEQIRGEPIDGRTDEYALACVLYECLAGLPPFHRETEAESLWAHMQDDVAPLHEHPRLNVVLRKGLAKERDERYGSCTELIEEAARAFAQPAGTEHRRRGPPSVLRQPRAIVAAGALVIAATVAAAAALVLTRDGAGAPPVESGVAAIGPTAARVGSFIEAATAPSNIAVGEGAVWVLNTEDKTISRIDPTTKRVVTTFQSPHRPVDLAAGAGALWVGNADERTNLSKTSISRLNPNTGRVTGTVQVPRKPDRGGWENSGHAMIAVGAGGVWTGNREGTISRLDPNTGAVVTTIDTFARRIAAGREGVWVVGVDGNEITGIDPRTNKVFQHVNLGAYLLNDIAVGAGSVWAVSQEGLLYRIPAGAGPRPLVRSIDVGVGTEFVAFGDGQVWTANFVDGTVSRVDPRTNTVVAKVRVGATQALAAGTGSAWVSVARGTRDGALPATSCEEVFAGGRRPDVLIASDLPLQGPDGGTSRAMADAIRFVLKDHGYRAGAFAVGYQSCDDSTAQTGDFERRKCAANANAYVGAANLVAVIGPYQSRCAQVEIPILNQAPGGPLSIVSASNTFPDLTRGGRLALPPPLGVRGEPEVYYPTGERNYARVISRDDLEGVALAVLARRLRLKHVYLLYDAFEAGTVSWTGPFRRTAAPFGVGIAGTREYGALRDFRALARTIAGSRADGVVIGGRLNEGVLKALHARLGRNVTIMAGSEFSDIPELLKLAGVAGRGLYVATTQMPADGFELTPAATRFTREFGSAAYGSFVLQAAQATEVVLSAIARSDGTRASVLRELHRTRVVNGLLGSFSFDRNGDMTPGKVVILHVTGATPPDLHLPDEFQGAVVDSVETVPAALSG